MLCITIDWCNKIKKNTHCIFFQCKGHFERFTYLPKVQTKQIVGIVLVTYQACACDKSCKMWWACHHQTQDASQQWWSFPSPLLSQSSRGWGVLKRKKSWKSILKKTKTITDFQNIITYSCILNYFYNRLYHVILCFDFLSPSKVTVSPFASHLALLSESPRVCDHWTSPVFPPGSRTSLSRSPQPAWWSATRHLYQGHSGAGSGLTVCWSPKSHLTWSLHLNSPSKRELLGPSIQEACRGSEHRICMSE